MTSRPPFRKEDAAPEHGDPFRAAVQALACSAREAASEHPDPAALVAYEAGTLETRNRERVADHLAVCPSCVALLTDHRELAARSRAEPGFPLDDAQAAEGWSTIRQRFAAADEGDRVPSLAEVVPLASRQEASPPDADERQRRPRVARRIGRGWVAVAAVVFLALSLWFLSLEMRLARVDDQQVNVAVAFLAPEQTMRSSGTPVSLALLAGDLTLVLGAGELAAEVAHRARLFDAAGVEVWQVDGLVRDADERFSLRLPGRLLGAGAYRLQIEARGKTTLRAVYRFVIAEGG